MRFFYTPSRAIVACFAFALSLSAQSKTPAPAPANAAPLSSVDPSVVPEMVPNADGTGLMLARAKENYSDITLKGSVLPPQTPLLGGREQRPTFIRELWQVRWRPNDAIDLYVIRPAGVKNPPVVLYLYGYPTETSRFKDDGWCQRVTGTGAAAVGFVSALTGHRDDHRPITENFITQMPEALAATTHDVQLILDYLATRNDLDMSRVGMFGQGSGGAVTVLAAAADPRIKAIDLLDPWGDWPVWFADSHAFPENLRAEFLTPEFQQELQPLDPVRYLPTLTGIKIRIQLDADSTESKGAAAKLDTSAPRNATVLRYASARRMYTANAGGHLFDWLSTQLGAKPAPLPPASSQTATTTSSANAAHPAAPAQPKP